MRSKCGYLRCRDCAHRERPVRGFGVVGLCGRGDRDHPSEGGGLWVVCGHVPL